jgi:hypothetical protein
LSESHPGSSSILAAPFWQALAAVASFASKLCAARSALLRAVELFCRSLGGTLVLHTVQRSADSCSKFLMERLVVVRDVVGFHAVGTELLGQVCVHISELQSKRK